MAAEMKARVIALTSTIILLLSISTIVFFSGISTIDAITEDKKNGDD